MEEVKIFKSNDFGEVRTIKEEDKVLFCGSDIAKGLGYVIPHKAINTHCKGVLKRNIHTSGGEQEMLFIPEGDVYRLIIKSKLPLAEKFEKWIFEEVLPTIRKTGGYIQNDDLFLNTYLPSADEATKILFKAQLQVVRSLNNKVEKLEEEKEILLTESLTIEDSRTLINAMIRKIAANKFHNNFSACWNSFYIQLNYKLGININSRNKKSKESLINTLTKEEMIEAEKVVRAWAVNLEMDLSDILNLRV